MCWSQDESVLVGLFCVYQRGRIVRLREHVLACMSIVVGSYFRNPIHKIVLLRSIPEP